MEYVSLADLWAIAPPAILFTTAFIALVTDLFVPAAAEGGTTSSRPFLPIIALAGIFLAGLILIAQVSSTDGSYFGGLGKQASAVVRIDGLSLLVCILIAGATFLTIATSSLVGYPSAVAFG